MRIIKPQQLAVLKSGYQIGQQSWLGVSLVAGCWLSKPAHFATFTQIWQAWSRAPHGFPVLDSAEPKPFAEFLLAGIVSRPGTAARAAASVTVGPLDRHWQIDAERDDSGQLLPFTPCPLSHEQTLLTGDNPLGGSDARLVGADETTGLIAPTPVPQQFPLRQRWLSAVQPEMQSEHYRQHVFPGMPAALDARYFQLAPQSQQLQSPAWSAGTQIHLMGFSSQDSAQHFTLPEIEARCFYQRRDTAPAALDMPLKTLWLLPDSNLILLVYTGRIPLTHLLDDSIVTFAAALDNTQAKRPDSHFLDVLARRSAADAPPFEFLYDPDLMPSGLPLDAIVIGGPAAQEGHPCDQRLVQECYTRINQLRGQGAKSDTDIIPPDLSELDSLGSNGREQSLSAGLTHRGKHFTLSMTGSYSNILFQDCRFSDCQFRSGVWHQLQFERCRFENCLWDDFAITDSMLTQCTFTACRSDGFSVDQVSARDTQFIGCDFTAWHSSACRWDNLLMQRCQWPAASFSNDIITGWTLDDSTLPDAVFKKGLAERVLIRKADLHGLRVYHWTLCKASLVNTDLSSSYFSHSAIDGMTCAQDCNLSRSELSECVLKKVGLAHGDLYATKFEACAIEESSADGANLRKSHFTRCDMAGIRLQQADLDKSHWHQTSLQQACLYNASLSHAVFTDCNLTGANFAHTHDTNLACFDNCLLSAACWLPHRKQSSEEQAP
ncbi:pentapeptide repeat-containing protein (plasmid) [Pantoea dispersa]|uniref:DUF2169 family type VI secretion system accessory protein n=1 Tax=Pantoea dispersa TaxID=59814 RepID=UPI001CA6876D|nr:pentapeptide repeat-containing protein [Pantoea dispersa]QZY93070.1 pentapeptide repeat-containing protein [Pantoea dispersa]